MIPSDLLCRYTKQHSSLNKPVARIAAMELLQISPAFTTGIYVCCHQLPESIPAPCPTLKCSGLDGKFCGPLTEGPYSSTGHISRDSVNVLSCHREPGRAASYLVPWDSWPYPFLQPGCMLTRYHFLFNKSFLDFRMFRPNTELFTQTLPSLSPKQQDNQWMLEVGIKLQRRLSGM